jgi:hypothetical protein
MRSKISKKAGVFDLPQAKIVYSRSEVCVNHVSFPACFAQSLNTKSFIARQLFSFRRSWRHSSNDSSNRIVDRIRSFVMMREDVALV